MRFRRDPNSRGLRLKPLQGTRDSRIYTIRANRDVRIVLALDGPRTTLLNVDHHDRAITWALKHRLKVNPRTGTLQIYEDAGAGTEYPSAPVFAGFADDPAPSPAAEARSEDTPLFSGEDGDYLLALGVPEEWLARIRLLRTHEDLEALEPALPEEAYEALLDIATGGRPVPADPLAEDSDPWADGDAARRFRVTENEEDLATALSRAWPDWAVWLHPDQRRAVERHHLGPARVTGGPGTGKSVVLMHRAARAAARGETVLLATYSAPLARKLAEGVDLLLSGAPGCRNNVSVRHLHGIAGDVLRRTGGASVVASDARLMALFGEWRGSLDGRFSDAFLLAEWRAVVDFWGVTTAESYRTVPRTGRGTALPARDRETLWEVFAAVRQAMHRAGEITWSDACERAAERAMSSRESQFDHVLIDEAQDFGPRELAFATSLSKRGGDGLFFAGDVNQRIYRWPFPWTAVGIDVRGRATRLRINYRTGGRIREFADRMVQGLAAESSDDRAKSGELSLFAGPLDPEVVACKDVAAEAGALQGWLSRRIAEGTSSEEIAILARTPERLAAVVRPALSALGLEECRLGDLARSGSVNAGTLHAAKGLEFRAVGIVGAEAGTMPLSSEVDAETEADARAQVERRERNLLFVAATRARDALLVTHVGLPSPFLASADVGEERE